MEMWRCEERTKGWEIREEKGLVLGDVSVLKRACCAPRCVGVGIILDLGSTGVASDLNDTACFI